MKTVLNAWRFVKGLWSFAVQHVYIDEILIQNTEPLTSAQQNCLNAQMFEGFNERIQLFEYNFYKCS